MMTWLTIFIIKTTITFLASIYYKIALATQEFGNQNQIDLKDDPEDLSEPYGTLFSIITLFTLIDLHR